MYESFYGLSSKPFQLSPDPNFYFGSKQHRRAKAYLDYGVLRNDGFIVITGEIGAGKTTLLRGLLDSLNRSNVVIGNLVTTQLDAEDTLRLVGAAFGVRVKDLPKSELLMSLEAFFVNQASQGKRCLLIVDEAQNLSAKAVEELRMLSNFQFGNQSLLQTFLVGQPEFRGILQKPEMEQFRQRVAATCHIGPLDEDETQRYIEHRLKCAGSTGKPSFEAEAFPAIYKASGGIPRRINSLCDRLLLLGFMSGKTHLALADVDEALLDIAQEVDAGRPAAVQDGASLQLADLDASLAAGIDGSRLRLSAADVAGLSAQFAGLGQDAQEDRLQRFESSLIRLERLNLQTLSLLQKLVESVKVG
ncbi:putative secretion ATPase (PEP-CTERM system associated) [Paucibacter oligotrophus]|uniref:Putative secretion ATPase (PEP-CTERM system associated) n=1 Tax=Roseateles oligotrophus TaxID=1769250 RepID=A0A840LDI6_9BURK|nr:XrtA/PEP-CTERM system-associated ATPase [Roseateles oligotrophus]MBB4844129.1 putative secretion ATPase (PEP-CTERM system associated) [Roseateles oligotrophus]